jgi:hypothetical protein
LLVAAEAAALAFALLAYLADRFLGLGPDGTLTGVLVLTALVLGIVLLAGLPPLIWLGARSLLATSSRNTLDVGSLVVGICLWLLVAAWLSFGFLASGR